MNKDLYLYFVIVFYAFIVIGQCSAVGGPRLGIRTRDARRTMALKCNQHIVFRTVPSKN